MVSNLNENVCLDVKLYNFAIVYWTQNSKINFGVNFLKI